MRHIQDMCFIILSKWVNFASVLARMQFCGRSSIVLWTFPVRVAIADSYLSMRSRPF